jgi:hypothetical protein
MRELRCDLHLANESLPQEARGELRVEHLDRDAPIGVLFDGEIHARHPPDADLPLDVVAWRETLPQHL